MAATRWALPFIWFWVLGNHPHVKDTTTRKSPVGARPPKENQDGGERVSGTALVLALIAGYIFAVLIRSFVSDTITEYQFWILWLVNANLLYQAIEEHLYKFHYFIEKKGVRGCRKELTNQH